MTHLKYNFQVLHLIDPIMGTFTQCRNEMSFEIAENSLKDSRGRVLVQAAMSSFRPPSYNQNTSNKPFLDSKTENRAINSTGISVSIEITSTKSE